MGAELKEVGESLCAAIFPNPLKLKKKSTHIELTNRFMVI